MFKRRCPEDRTELVSHKLSSFTTIYFCPECKRAYKTLGVVHLFLERAENWDQYATSHLSR